MRADCEMSGEGYSMVTKGAADVMMRDIGVDQGRAIAMQIGSGNKFEDAPDISSFYVSETRSGSVSLVNKMHGELYNCEGCLDGDLSNFNGNPNDVTASAFMVMRLEADSEWFKLQMGDSVADHFVMVAKDVGSGRVKMEVDGRLIHEDHNRCNFDVTYDTEQPVVTTNFQQGGDETEDGRINVTDNSSGEVYVVEFHANGDVTVNGNLVDVDKVAGACDELGA